MTHRDGFPRLSARSAWRSDAGHRQPCATPSESLGKPPFRSGRRTAGGRRKASTMPRIARPISMGHYQRSLVSRPTEDNSASPLGPCIRPEAFGNPAMRVRRACPRAPAMDLDDWLTSGFGLSEDFVAGSRTWNPLGD